MAGAGGPAAPARGALLLVAALLRPPGPAAAADERRLFKFSVQRGATDPQDAQFTQAPPTLPPELQGKGTGWDMDTEADKGIRAAKVMQSQTSAPTQDFGKNLRYSWVSFCVLVLGACFISCLMSACSFLCWQTGRYDLRDSEAGGNRDQTREQNIFLATLGVILLLLVAFIVGLCVAVATGRMNNPFVKRWQEVPGAAGRMINQEEARINKLLHPPPPSTTMSPVMKSQAAKAMHEAAAAMKQVKELEKQLAAAQAQIAAKQRLAPKAPPHQGPQAPTQPPPEQAHVKSLQDTLAALKKKAQAKAAQALPAQPTAPPDESGYGTGGGDDYGATSNYGPAPAAPAAPAAAAAMVSPCATTTPAMSGPPPGQPGTPPPVVSNFMPPVGCNCKASVGQVNGISLPAHCGEYPGHYDNKPVCLLANPGCGGDTQDAGTGVPTDLVVTCIASPEGGSTYAVGLDRAVTNMKLGLDVAPDASLKRLIVTKVTGGLADVWNGGNVNNPSVQIKPGDMITSVNGVTGSAVTLMKECIKKQLLNLILIKEVGYPVAMRGSTQGGAPPALAPTQPPAHGDCPEAGRGWGDVSVCLSNTAGFPPGSSLWHCPWESMMLESTQTFGSCDAVKIDCTGTNFNAVLDLYKKHDNNITHPPEGSLKTVEYAHCCVKHQCGGGPPCGEGPWIPGKSVSPFLEAGVSPCGSAGCERLYSLPQAIKARGMAVPVLPALLAIAGSVFGVAVWVHRARAHRRGAQRDDVAEHSEQEFLVQA